MIDSKYKIKINRSFFSRNRHREKQYDDVFSITYKSLSGLSNIVFFIVFPPVIAIGNLFSHGVFLSIMNIFLSIGYCAKFIQKIKEGEVSQLELIISLLFVCFFLALTFYLAPVLSVVNLIDVIGLINLIATGINSFFLIRNIFIPPFQALIRYICTSLGYEITANFFNKIPLSLEHDRPVLDRLLRKFYKHDSHSDNFQEHEIAPFNNMLLMLSHYINKYSEPFLGNLINHDRINLLENAVSQFIINGNTDNSLVFINRKIDFKHTKINLLKQSRRELTNGRDEKNAFNYRFFDNISPPPEDDQDEVYETALSRLDEEINRQNKKIERLKSCVTMLSAT